MDVSMPHLSGLEAAEQHPRAALGARHHHLRADGLRSDAKTAAAPKKQASTIIWSSLWTRTRCCSCSPDSALHLKTQAERSPLAPRCRYEDNL